MVLVFSQNFSTNGPPVLGRSFAPISTGREGITPRPPGFSKLPTALVSKQVLIHFLRHKYKQTKSHRTYELDMWYVLIKRSAYLVYKKRKHSLSQKTQKS